MKSTVTLRHRSVRYASVALLMVGTLPAPSQAEDFWREAKAYTRSVVGAYEAAVKKLADAKDHLATATTVLQAARAQLYAAGAAATGALAAAVVEATAAVAAAETAITVAAAGVEIAILSAAAFFVGTGIAQGDDYLISFCWDPVCPIATADVNFWSPTDAELDAMIPDLIFNAVNVPLSKADFDLGDTIVPGSGTASWNYLRAGVRNFVIATRGAGAFSEGRSGDVLQAANVLQESIRSYTLDIQTFASLLEATPTFTGDPTGAIQAAVTELNNLQALVAQFDDPAAMQAAIDDARAGLNLAQSGLNDAGDGAGNPVMLDGEFFLPVSLSDFQQFLLDCDAFGVGCLPDVEVIVTDRLMDLLGATFAGSPSIAAQIAAWDALGDNGNEAALFTQGGGVLNVSQILTTAIPNHWDRIDLSQSPLVLQSQPDQLHLIGPIPTKVTVGSQGSINASVQRDFVGFSNAPVVFTKSTGSFTFAVGDVSPDGTQATALADTDGVAIMTFIGDAPGPGLIKATIPGTELTTYSFFEIVAPPVPLLCDIDGDGNIDLHDLNLFAECLGGPDNPSAPPGCDAATQAAADCDADSDVDMRDFAMFQDGFVSP